MCVTIIHQTTWSLSRCSLSCNKNPAVPRNKLQTGSVPSWVPAMSRSIIAPTHCTTISTDRQKLHVLLTGSGTVGCQQVTVLKTVTHNVPNEASGWRESPYPPAEQQMGWDYMIGLDLRQSAHQQHWTLSSYKKHTNHMTRPQEIFYFYPEVAPNFKKVLVHLGLHLVLPVVQLPALHKTKPKSPFYVSLVSNKACAMFTNDHLELHCIDNRMNHFIYMSLHCFQGQIKDSGIPVQLQSIMRHVLMNPCRDSGLRLEQRVSVTKSMPLQCYFRGVNIA